METNVNLLLSFHFLVQISCWWFRLCLFPSLGLLLFLFLFRSWHFYFGSRGRENRLCFSNQKRDFLVDISDSCGWICVLWLCVELILKLVHVITSELHFTDHRHTLIVCQMSNFSKLGVAESCILFKLFVTEIDCCVEIVAFLYWLTNCFELTQSLLVLCQRC